MGTQHGQDRRAPRAAVRATKSAPPRRAERTTWRQAAGSSAPAIQPAREGSDGRPWGLSRGSTYSAIRSLAPLRAQGARLVREHWPAILLSVLGALLGLILPGVLLGHGFTRSIDSSLRSLDLDDERIHLVDMVLVTLAGALLAACLTQRRLAPLLGGSAYAIFSYLLPFIQRAEHPGPGPGGVPQVLVPGALTATAVTLGGFGVLAAASGGTLGAALGGVTLTPLATLGAAAWRIVRRRQPGMRAAVVVRSVLALGLAGVLGYALLVVVGGSGNLLSYGLTTGLYTLRGSWGHPGQEVPHGTVLQATYLSPALGGARRSFYIYLPPSYNVTTTVRYPTLYLLHGTPGNAHNWMGAGRAAEIEDALVAAGKMRETIIVAPDGNGPVYQTSAWINAFDGKQRMEDSIVQDLVPYVDAHYRTLADAADRAIAGNSEGGYGAAVIALHHPDVFRTVVSMGGFFEAPATGEPGLYGEGARSPAYRLYESPSRYVATPTGIRAAHQVAFYICVASDDGPLYTSGVNFYHRLQQMGVKAQLQTSQGGHSWTIWSSQLGSVLPEIEPPVSA